MLRQQSSVTLEALGLQGTGTQRRVALDVTIDGKEGAALGVMSQGELNSLALSLFLPRAAMPESPFRFVIIDDPVQSMDPAKVDGLARVLADTAADRQVVVFTHDDRLCEAVERLRIPARVVGVTRRENSVVELADRTTPSEHLLSEARAVAYAEQISAAVRARVVPGLCRQAIEAACAQVTRRRRIGRGEVHADVEALFAQATTLKMRIALAILDDPQRAGDVLSRLNQKPGPWAADLVRRLDSGTHKGDEGSLPDLIRDTKSFVSLLVGGGK